MSALATARGWLVTAGRVVYGLVLLTVLGVLAWFAQSRPEQRKGPVLFVPAPALTWTFFCRAGET